VSESKEKTIRASYKGMVLNIETDVKPAKALEALLFMILHEYNKKSPTKLEAFIKRVNEDYERVKNKDKLRVEEMEDIEDGFEFFNWLMQLPPMSLNERK